MKAKCTQLDAVSSHSPESTVVCLRNNYRERSILMLAMSGGIFLTYGFYIVYNQTLWRLVQNMLQHPHAHWLPFRLQHLHCQLVKAATGRVLHGREVPALHLHTAYQ
jgi:hypothetical protein